MHMLRAFLYRNRPAAIVLVLAALCMKALVPAGFMIGQGPSVITIEICNDASGAAMTKQLVIPAKGGPADSKGQGDKSECSFSSLAMAAVGGADIALLAGELAFILALAFAPSPRRTPARAHYLRPPLRGPPALA